MNRKDNNDLLNYVSVYHDTVYDVKNLKSATLEDIFEKIRTSGFLKKHSDTLRTIPTDNEQKIYKQNNFPYFNLGAFNNNYRKNVNLKSSSFFLFDYDHLDSKLDDMKSLLKADDRVFAFFVSPRGNGLKVIYRLENEITDPTFFSQLYKHYANEFKIDLGVDPDKTSDPSRPCYFSYDPELYINTNSVPLKTDVVIAASINQKTFNTFDLINSTIDSVLLKRAVEFLRNEKINYNNWLGCGFALAPLGEYGRQLFQLLSDNPNYNDTPEEVDRKFQNFVANPTMYNEIDMLYMIAVNYGFEIFSIKKEKSVETVISFEKELEEQFLLDDTRDPNKLLGFPLTKFKELAGHVDGLQRGFYLLGAESNVGKTAVLTNMCLDVLETNPEVTVVYFSLDDSRKYTAYRFLSIMTKLGINDTHKQQTDPVKKLILESGRKDILDLARSGRLIVKDTSEVCTIDELKAVIKDIPDKSKLVVFIDGLYNLEVGERFKGGIREENIERARQVKLLVDTYGIPILTTGELRKKAKDEGKDKAPTVHDLMETGKFAYNANVVWLLYGKTAELSGDEPILTLEYVKNKLSDYKSLQFLSFKRATGTMKELSILLPTPTPLGPLFNDGGGLE